MFEKFFLSTITCVPNFVASNYHKVIFVSFLFLYWFALFPTFGRLPSENPRCAPDFNVSLLLRRI